MTWRHLFLIALIIVIVWLLYDWWSLRPITYGPGIMAPGAPIQKNIVGVKPFYYKDYKIIPLAHFSAKARILSRERYYFGRSASLSPIDLALGWGPMSDEKVLASISIRQSNRFYYWFAKKYPIPKNEIIENSANMHIIPANSSVRKKLLKARKGSIVTFSGYLIKIEANDGWRWNSSLKRTDSGKGACELVWVEEFDSL